MLQAEFEAGLPPSSPFKEDPYDEYDEYDPYQQAYSQSSGHQSQQGNSSSAGMAQLNSAMQCVYPINHPPLHLSPSFPVTYAIFLYIYMLRDMMPHSAHDGCLHVSTVSKLVASAVRPLCTQV